MSRKQLAENMKNMRLLRGMTIKEVADSLGCVTNTIVNWESGRVSPVIDFVENICNLYQIPPNQLFGYEKCPELEEFLNNKQQIIIEMKALQQERSEIDKRLKAYADMLSDNVDFSKENDNIK